MSCFESETDFCFVRRHHLYLISFFSLLLFFSFILSCYASIFTCQRILSAYLKTPTQTTTHKMQAVLLSLCSVKAWNLFHFSFTHSRSLENIIIVLTHITWQCVVKKRAHEYKLSLRPREREEKEGIMNKNEKYDLMCHCVPMHSLLLYAHNIFLFWSYFFSLAQTILYDFLQFLSLSRVCIWWCSFELSFLLKWYRFKYMSFIIYACIYFFFLEIISIFKLNSIHWLNFNTNKPSISLQKFLSSI